MIEATETTFGRLDILVNNAGIMLRGQPQQLTEDAWRQVLDKQVPSCALRRLIPR